MIITKMHLFGQLSYLKICFNVLLFNYIAFILLLNLKFFYTILSLLIKSFLLWPSKMQ